MHRARWAAVVSDELGQLRQGYDVRGTRQLQSECVITHLAKKEEEEKHTSQDYTRMIHKSHKLHTGHMAADIHQISPRLVFPSTQELRSCNVKLIQCVFFAQGPPLYSFTYVSKYSCPSTRLKDSSTLTQALRDTHTHTTTEPFYTKRHTSPLLYAVESDAPETLYYTAKISNVPAQPFPLTLNMYYIYYISALCVRAFNK